MPEKTLAAIHAVTLKIHCLGSLTLAIGDTLVAGGETRNPVEGAEIAADLARIAFDELRSLERRLVEIEQRAAELLDADLDPRAHPVVPIAAANVTDDRRSAG